MWIRWYSFIPVLHELRKVMINREVTYMNYDKLIIRPLKIYSTYGLRYSFRQYNFFDKFFNLYTSLAVLKEVPDSQSNEDLALNREYLRKNWDKLVIGNDFLIDIDCDDLSQAYKWAKKIFNLFKKNNIPFSVIFSGKAGFHFRIPYEIMKMLRIPKKRQRDKYREIAEKISQRLKIPFDKGHGICWTSYIKHKIVSVPYSIHAKTDLVRLPLTDEQFQNFNKDDYTVDNVLKNVMIMNRGLLIRKGDIKQLKKI